VKLGENVGKSLNTSRTFRRSAADADGRRIKNEWIRWRREERQRSGGGQANRRRGRKVK
jgi:hypothetical protein